MSEVIVITSGKGGAGKTTTSANMAAVYHAHDLQAGPIV